MLTVICGQTSHYVCENSINRARKGLNPARCFATLALSFAPSESGEQVHMHIKVGNSALEELRDIS